MSKQLPSYVGLVVLYVACFFTLHWIYGYVFLVQSETNDGFFMYGRQFLLEFLDRPGDPLRYAGRFLSQFYHYQWLGALIVSACIACFGVVFHRVLVKLNGNARAFQVVLPCLFLLGLHTSTMYVIHDTLGLCASCGALLGLVSLRGNTGRFVFAMMATPILYLLLGAYVWVFVAWMIALPWFDGPRVRVVVFKAIYAIVAIASPLVAWRWLFSISWQFAVMWPLVYGPPVRDGSPPYTVTHVTVDFLLAATLLVSLLLLPLWGRVSWGTRLAAIWQAGPVRVRRVVLVVSLSVFAVVFHAIRYDGALSSLVACNQLYRHKQWDALLDQAGHNAHGDPRVQFMTDFALCQKRRLLHEMFRYDQVWGSRGLVFHFSDVGVHPAENDNYRAMYNSDLFYEMGHINAAFRHAYNTMWVRKRRYDVLRRMALCSIVNGNYDLAAKYLNLLERTTFHKEFARHHKNILADPDAIEREFGPLAARLPIVEDNMRFHPVTPFVQLLDAKPDNSMAFDYLMACVLLDKSLIAEIPGRIDQFKYAGYSSLPRHCQEALLLLERLQGKAIDLRGFRYDPATAARVECFFQDASRLSDRDDAPQQLRALYGDTYMFYYYFWRPPPVASRYAAPDYRGVPRNE